jgi:hypothetical protein
MSLPSVRKALRKLKLLLFKPAEWSAEHYRDKNTYDTVATNPEKWTDPKRKPPTS